MEATKVSVVSSGCWLLFSRGKEVEKRTISFSESGSSDAVYYVQRARWAPTIAEMEEKDFECVLFIAAEFFENGDDDKWAGKNISKLPTDTCIVRVDENFHYGQGFLKGHRFVVYHPTNRKEMKQGRFRSNNLVVALKDTANIVPEIKAASVSVKLNPGFFKTLGDAGNKLLGNSLKVFPKPSVEAGKLGPFVKIYGKITYTTPALVRAMHGDTSGLDVETINAIDDAKETYFEEPEVKVDQEVYTTEDEENYNKEMEENVKLVVKHLSQCLDDGLYSFQTA